MSQNQCKKSDNVSELLETTLQSLQERFQEYATQLLTRIDEMGNRIVDLEKNINELMSQAEMEEQPDSEEKMPN